MLPNATIVSRLLMHSIVPVAARIVMTLALAVALLAREQLRLQLTHFKLLWLRHWTQDLDSAKVSVTVPMEEPRAMIIRKRLYLTHQPNNNHQQ